MICPWLKSGRHTCFQIMRVLGQSVKSISWRGPVFWHPLKRLTAASFAKSSVGTAVVFWRIWWAPSSRQFLRGLKLARGLAVSAQKLWLGAMITPLSNYLGNCWMGCLNFAGWGDQRSKAEFHSFVRGQRQVEMSSHRSRAPINSVFAFCSQPSLHSRRNLHRIGIFVFQSVSVSFIMWQLCCFRSFSWQR